MECVESEYAIDDLIIAGRVSEWAKTLQRRSNCG
jgi:hypothetical protein